MPILQTAMSEPIDLREKVRSLPTTAGVYLMKDALSRVIYVGKAVNLRSRVSSYFNSKAALDRRICDLVPEIRDVDHIGKILARRRFQSYAAQILVIRRRLLVELPKPAVRVMHLDGMKAIP